MAEQVPVGSSVLLDEHIIFACSFLERLFAEFLKCATLSLSESNVITDVEIENSLSSGWSSFFYLSSSPEEKEEEEGREEEAVFFLFLLFLLFLPFLYSDKKCTNNINK